jgi:hypothetical protein
MKTNYKYIKFEEWEHNGKTAYVCLNKKSGGILGFIEWYLEWNQYVLVPDSEMIVFSAECLDHIAHFIRQANARR